MITDAKRRWNWFPLAGFGLSLLAFFSYFFFFVEFPATRDFPWANLIIFLMAAGLLVVGIRRAFWQPNTYRGKIAGPILAALSAVLLGFFLTIFFVGGRQIPRSAAAPRVGAKAPDFTLMDSERHPVSLTALLTEPVRGTAPKGVLLVFYRGYW